MDPEKVVGNWGREKVRPCFYQRSFGWQWDKFQVMAKGLDRGNVFFLSGMAKGSEGDQVIFCKIFQPVIDDDRSADDLRMGEFLAGDQDFHHRIFISKTNGFCPAKFME
jgi:hypothetical protein